MTVVGTDLVPLNLYRRSNAPILLLAGPVPSEWRFVAAARALPVAISP